MLLSCKVLDTGDEDLNSDPHILPTIEVNSRGKQQASVNPTLWGWGSGDQKGGRSLKLTGIPTVKPECQEETLSQESKGGK